MLNRRPTTYRQATYWRALVMSVLLVAVLTVPTIVPAVAQTDLLTNGGFEATSGSPVSVARGWSSWNAPIPANAPGYVGVALYRLTSTPARVLSGSAAQELFEFFAIYDGGVYQTVNSTSGSDYEFRTSVYIWSTELENPDTSDNPSPVTVQIGLDPTGGTNGTAASVQYSPATPYGSGDYDKYRAFAKTVRATGNRLTVFVRVTFTDPKQSNHAYIDSASLRIAGATQVTNTPNAVATTPAVVATTPNVVVTREGTVEPNPTNPTPSTVASVTPTVRIVTATASFTAVVPSATVATATVVPPTATLTPIPPSLTPSNTFTATIPVTATLFVPSPAPLNPNPTDIPLFPTATVPTLTPSSTFTPIPTNTPIPTVTPIISPTAPVDVIPLTGPTVNGIGTYIIQPGDRFEAVAARYGITVAELARLNGIVNPSRIAIGQVLVVPGPGNNYPGGTSAPTAFPTPTSAPATSFNYTVQPGDYLINIAARYGVSPAAILQLNGIANANLLYVGQVIRIPFR